MVSPPIIHGEPYFYPDAIHAGYRPEVVDFFSALRTYLDVGAGLPGGFDDAPHLYRSSRPSHTSSSRSCAKPTRGSAAVTHTWTRSSSRGTSSSSRTGTGALSRAARLEVVGYSMPPDDIEIRTLLRAGVERGADLGQVVVRNPTPDVHDRIRRYLDRNVESDYRGISML